MATLYGIFALMVVNQYYKYDYIASWMEIKIAYDENTKC